MGIVSDIINRAYIIAWLTSNNVDAPSAERYCDDIYQELVDLKKLSNESYIKKRHYIDTVPYTNKYLLPNDFEKMTMVSIRYNQPFYDAWVTGSLYEVWDKITDSGKAYICIEDHTAWWSFAWDSTKRNQIWEWYKVCDEYIADYEMKEDFNMIGFYWPVYFYDNNHIYIYPRSKEAVIDGIILDYIPVSERIETITDDDDIQIEAKLHRHWEMWVAMKMRWHIRDTDWQSTLLIQYQQWVEQCKDRWARRHYNKQKQTLPSSLTRYMR